MSEPFVAILMGSDSDIPVIEPAFVMHKSLSTRFEAKVNSAHRTPKATHEGVVDTDQRGCAAFIGAALQDKING